MSQMGHSKPRILYVDDEKENLSNFKYVFRRCYEIHLALCAEAGAMPVIVITKADLVDDADTYISRARKTHSGVAVEAINALEPDSPNGLRSWIDSSSTVALVGSSGVGKSTILNTLAGHSIASTGEKPSNPSNIFSRARLSVIS